MTPNDERERLIEAAAGAWRPRSRRGRVGPHPAYADLDADGREEAFEVATQMRRLEAAIDPEGLSTTARGVLERILDQNRPR